MNQAYPLAWPAGVGRAKLRNTSRFEKHTVAQGVIELRRQISLLGGKYPIISSNIPLKADGNPYSDPGRMPDPGAAVYFQLKGKPYCLPCDQWFTVEENFWAVAKHIEAMRGMQRWGVGSVEQQFAGFKALEAGESCWEVLGVPPGSNQAEVLKSYRARVYGSDAAAERGSRSGHRHVGRFGEIKERK